MPFLASAFFADLESLPYSLQVLQFSLLLWSGISKDRLHKRAIAAVHAAAQRIHLFVAVEVA